jgi:hypothetical protein
LQDRKKGTSWNAINDGGTVRFVDITNTAEGAALYFEKAIASNFRMLNVIY